MTTLSRDTSAVAEAVMLRIFRDMPAWRRLELLDDACRTARELTRAGLRSRNPGASAERIERLMMDLLLGEELAAAAFGPPTP
ncbi:MAG: hypothetical protein GXP47_09790 [Acidobacteria bacterium]|nr:hypothetical protein [Acidobacteriota bacterium]